MFFMVTLTKELEVHPRFFGPRLREEIERRLRLEVRRAGPHAGAGGVVPLAGCPSPSTSSPVTQVEGTCNARYGFILAVLAMEDVGKGLIREGSGAAVFPVRYRCICFKPFKGEVMDVLVTSVNKARPRLRAAACGGGGRRR